jgi:hypothetical protein
VKAGGFLTQQAFGIGNIFLKFVQAIAECPGV